MLTKLISVVVAVVATGSLALACSSPPQPEQSDAAPPNHATPDAATDAERIKPDAGPTQCAAMFDISLEATAEDECRRSTDCVVCVQEIGPGGVPVKWLAQENASVCPCPAIDAGVLNVDAGPHADAAPSDDGGPSVDGSKDAASDAACVATYDIGTKSMAEQICAASTDCAVCVQKVDAHGNATTWLAQQNASYCPCPALTP